MVNTLEIFETLKAADLTDKQARAITHAVQKSFEDRLANLATKQDLVELEMKLVKYIFGQAVIVIGSVVTILHFLK